MKIKIYENRRVYLSSNILGVDNENKVEEIEIEYPEIYADFVKTIEMSDDDEWKVVDAIENDKYTIKNNVTTHKKISIQFVFRDMSEENVVFKSEKINVRFLDAINATEEIEEENQDIIVALVDAKFDAVMDELDSKYVAQEEGKGLSENDFTNEYKQDVDDNTNARHTHENKLVLDNINNEDIQSWNNKAEISDIPTELSELTEDAAHRTVTDIEKASWNNKSDFDGDYNSLENKPTIPTQLSQLSDDSTHRLVTDLEKTRWENKSDFSGNYEDLTNKPTIPSALSELTDDSTHRTVSDTEKSNWDNKSDFSGNYNDLSGKPIIPTALSELQEDSTHRTVTDTEKSSWNSKADMSDIPDVSNFITKLVNDLVNYYTKSESYTKTEVNNLIGAIQQFHYEIVQELPQIGANNILYLVPKTTTGTQNIYDEYVYANNSWEMIGNTQIDLTGYATEIWVNTQIADFLTATQIQTLINTAVSGKYEKPNTGIPKTDLANDVQASLGKADTAIQQHQDISGKEDKSNKTTTIDAQSTDTQYPSAKCVFDAIAQAGGGADNIFEWDGESSSSNPDNLVLWQRIFDKQKTNNCIVVTNQDVMVIGKNTIANTESNKNIYGLLRSFNNYVSSKTNNTADIKRLCTKISVTNGNVTSVNMVTYSQYSTDISYLHTGVNYATPYTPLYPGSPATKKYVDDLVGNINTLLGGI